MEELMQRLEALLFSSGRKMTDDELARLTRMQPEQIPPVLKDLQQKFDDAESALMIVQEGGAWKLSVREKYVSLARQIVTETELSKTIMETLAVVAWKAPVLQSDVIRVRTNKAYDHLAELEEAGFITRKKHGRTNLIRLSEKFFKYFDVDEARLKEQFSGVKEASTAVEKLDQKNLEQYNDPVSKEILAAVEGNKTDAAPVIEDKKTDVSHLFKDEIDEERKKQEDHERNESAPTVEEMLPDDEAEDGTDSESDDKGKT